MRRFLTGLLLGFAVMYGYVYYKDALVMQVKAWFAEASHDPDAEAKVEEMFSNRR